MSFVLDFLFPKKCVGCGKEGTYFCADCVNDIKQGDLVCPRCERLAIGGATHPVCRRKYGLDGLWSLGVYQDPLRAAIQKLKYKPKLVRDFAPVLVDILLEYWAKYQPFLLDEIKKDKGKGWVVVPVPLFWWRHNDRGFNQSALLGQFLSKKLGLNYCEALKRTRYTRSQTKLSERERRQNIKNAFEITPSYTRYPKPHTLLIDDVWTTGSTLRECCYVLKRAGAKKVWAITLAR
ncbi:ComF family protein [Candidatus Daviesbacteria bacterium]|nr:ComF family protein [Candidatus Daviesbacteria bacterium]